MHRPVAKIDLRLPIVKTKGGSRFRSVVVSRIAVGHRVALSYSVIGEVQVSVFATISPIEKPAVPIFRQGKLDMIANGR